MHKMQPRLDAIAGKSDRRVSDRGECFTLTRGYFATVLRARRLLGIDRAKTEVSDE